MAPTDPGGEPYDQFQLTARKTGFNHSLLKVMNTITVFLFLFFFFFFGGGGSKSDTEFIKKEFYAM